MITLENQKEIISIIKGEGIPDIVAAPYITVVIPVFNSHSTLRGLYQRIESTLVQARYTFEVVFVDDGSSDESWTAIQSLKKDFPKTVHGIKFARNTGQQAATYCGLLEANGKWVVTLDDDLQYSPEEIPKLLESAVASNADLLYGVHKASRHSILHNLGSSLFRWLIRSIAPEFPNGSSFRLVKREILSGLPETPGPGFYVDPILSWATDNIVTKEVMHQKRINGKSGYSLTRLFNLALSLLIVHSTVPLKIMIWSGLISSLVSFGIGSFYLLKKLTVGAVLGYSSLIVTITFVSGVILMSLGIIGVYIAKIYTIGSGQPAYIIQSKI